MIAKRQTLLYVLIGISCLITWVRARSISVIGDVNIDISEAKFICDKVECPIPATEQCIVTKEKDPNNAAVLVRTNICYSKTNEPLKNSVTRETVSPNSVVKFSILANRHGMISSVGSSYGSTAFDAENFNREMQTFQNNLQQNLNNMNRELSNLGANMGNMLG